jgi:hypothetical protein
MILFVDLGWLSLVLRFLVGSLLAYQILLLGQPVWTKQFPLGLFQHNQKINIVPGKPN